MRLSLPRFPRLRSCLHGLVTATMMVALLVLPTRAARSEQPAATSRPALSAPEVRKLVGQLDHPQFKTRQAATNMLCEASSESLPAMVEAYKAQPDHELKLRLRYAIEHVFYRKLLEGRLGFLGVALPPQAESGMYNPLTGRIGDVVRFARVLEGFPAEKAGFKNSDMVVEFDGKPIAQIIGEPRGQPRPVARAVGPAGQLLQGDPAGVQLQPGMLPRMLRFTDPRLDAFTAEVSRREPGSTVVVQVLRCQPSDRGIVLPLGAEPSRALDGAKLVRALIPALQARANDVTGAVLRPVLYVQSVADKSLAAKAGLKPGDVLAGLGREVFSDNASVEQIAIVLKGSQPDTNLRLIVNRVDVVKVQVTLGGRPVDRMNEGDMQIAQARLAEWWRAQTGEHSFRNSNRMSSFQTQSPPRILPDATVLP